MDIGTIISLIGLLILIIGGWISFRLQNQRFETATKMKLIELEGRINKHETDNKEEFVKAYDQNKEAHDKLFAILEASNKILVDIQIRLASKN